jgi:hypothetical protein
MNRWAKNGVLDRVFEQLQLEQIVRIRIEAFSLDSTSVKVHPDGTGALKKADPGHWKLPPRIEHEDSYGCADARTTIAFALSPGHDHDAPHGRALLEELGSMPEGLPLLMERAYEGNETRQLVLNPGMSSVNTP